MLISKIWEILANVVYLFLLPPQNFTCHVYHVPIADSFSPIRIMRRSLGIAHATCKKMRAVIDKLKVETAGFVPEEPPGKFSIWILQLI